MVVVVVVGVVRGRGEVAGVIWGERGGGNFGTECASLYFDTYPIHIPGL